MPVIQTLLCRLRELPGFDRYALIVFCCAMSADFCRTPKRSPAPDSDYDAQQLRAAVLAVSLAVGIALPFTGETSSLPAVLVIEQSKTGSSNALVRDENTAAVDSNALVHDENTVSADLECMRIPSNTRRFWDFMGVVSPVAALSGDCHAHCRDVSIWSNRLPTSAEILKLAEDLTQRY
eukprot:Lankesteria_metandrocarpae@DN1165_c0_g1_i2.p1